MSGPTVTVDKAWLDRVLDDLEYATARLRNQAVVLDANLSTLDHAQRRFERSEIEKAALQAHLDQQPTPVLMRHVARGTIYELICVGTVQTHTPLADYDQVMIYRGEDGQTWVRPLGEFNDGRFEPYRQQG